MSPTPTPAPAAVLAEALQRQLPQRSKSGGSGSEEEEEAKEAGTSINTDALAAAASAGSGELITSAVFYPIELVKSRLQAATEGDKGGSFAYRGLWHGLYCIHREEGIRGLFAGLPSVAVRSLATDLVSVYFGELLLGHYRQIGGQAQRMMAVPLRTLGACGSILLTLPLETVATRVTTARPPVGTATAIRQLYRENGLAAFWRGLWVSFLLCLNPAITFTAVESISDRLRALLQWWSSTRKRDAAPAQQEQQNQPQQLNWAQAFVPGAVAKLLTMLLVYPLVRGKILMQARDTGGRGIFQVLRQAAVAEGWLSLYRGLGAQLSKSLLSSSLKYAVKDRTETQWKSLVGHMTSAP